MRFLLIAIAFVFLGSGLVSFPKKGEKAPDFEISSPSGKSISLSKLKGKVVLVDFWASWCGPCRKENPNVVQAFEKYNKSKFKIGKGFEVLSVSLDSKKEAWIGAIEQDGLIWKNHGIDDKGEVSKLYGVASIPTAFLIDGEGTIVARGEELRGMGLHLALDEMLK